MVKESIYNAYLLTYIFISKICNITEDTFDQFQHHCSTNLMVEKTLKTCPRKSFKKILSRG